MKPLNRRTVLRGMAGGIACSVALPALEIMLNSHGDAWADGSALPIRFMTWFFGNGIWPDDWRPAAEGPNWPASKLTQPLFDRGVNEYVSILTGFDNLCPNPITHHEGMTAFTAHPFVTCSGLCSDVGGPTIDQVIASKIAERVQTTFQSVHVGVSRAESYMDTGTTMFALSHKGTGQPQYPEHSPLEVYNKLFASYVPESDKSGPARVRVLDAVREDVARLKKRIGVKDQQRLEAHLDSLSEVQKKIEALPPACIKPRAPTVTNPELPDPAGPEPLREVNEVMADLIAYAFACDLTRVATLLFTYGAGAHVFHDLGHTIEHHSFMSHDQQYVQNGKFQEGVIYEIDAFAYLLERLMKTPDAAGGNLLDNSILYLSSDSSWAHSIFDMPILVAGRGGGKLVHPGIHYHSTTGENMSDVLLTLLQCFDPEAKSIGSGPPMSTTPFMPIVAS